MIEWHLDHIRVVVSAKFVDLLEHSKAQLLATCDSGVTQISK